MNLKLERRSRFLQAKAGLNQAGMTLIEIMIVLAILGGLITILGGVVVGALDKSKVRQAKIQISEISKQLEIYYQDCNSYPTTDQGFQALIANPGPDACPNWGPNPYMKKEPKDPWGKSFIYESDGGTFKIISLGKDRKEGGDGYDKDISNEEQ